MQPEFTPKTSIGLNLFAIISDLYYRENFHSDVLKVLLDPHSPHKEDDKYLKFFLRFLQSQDTPIDLANYSNVRIEREERRIDLLIADEDSKRAIIIENKINGAGDMPRQIPRYLEYVTEQGYSCDAIIYLRLNGYSEPDTTDWSVDEIKVVKSLLTVICAYNETNNDLLNGWISKCTDASTNDDAKHIFRQYGAIITKLGGNVMNKPIMKQFYDKMLEGENYKTAQSLSSMLQDLVNYRRDNILDVFRSNSAPFNKLGPWQNVALFMNLNWQGGNICIDVAVNPDNYEFFFWDRSDREGKYKRAQDLLTKMNCLGEYVPVERGFQKDFSFPSQEIALFDHIKAFNQNLSKVTSTE